MIYLIDNTMIVNDDGSVVARQELLPFGTFDYTRGRDLYNLLCISYKDVIPYMQVDDANNNLVDIVEESIIFIHSGRQERFDDFWAEYASTCYFICYSGDTSPREFIRQRIDLEPTKVIFDNLTPNITAAEISKKWDIPRFIQTVISDKQNCLSYLKNTGKPYLSALSILCIGFLTQHKCEGFEFLTKINVPGDGLNKTETWRTVLGVNKVDAKANLELGSECHDIEALLDDLIYKNEPPDDSDKYKEYLISSDADKVKAAYKQISLQ